MLTPTRLLLLACTVATGCSFANIDRNTGRNPDVLTGMAATVIMPGQAPPPLPLPGATGTVRSSGAPGSTSGGSGGTRMGTGTGGGAPPAPGAGPALNAQGKPVGPPGYQLGAPPEQPSSGQFVVIGGAEGDEEKRREIRNQPIWLRPMLLPFAVLAYPFEKIADAVSGPEEATGPQTPRGGGLPDPRPVTQAEMQAAQERGIQDQMEREIAQRSGGGGAPAGAGMTATPSYPSADYASAAPPPGRPMSIAEELAALRAGRGGAAVPSAPGPSYASAAPSAAPAPRSSSSQTPSGVASQVEDRDRDGRPDRWVYADAGRTTREVLDDNGDGQPDRITVYDPSGRLPARSEEDANGDGVIDTWTQYENGQPSRRQSDTNGDGVPDDWTAFRDGQPYRNEQDTKGQGFRDRVRIYESGHLAREEEDRNGDGRPDVVTSYDSDGQVTMREEDTDGDGAMDVRSRYRNGKLASREAVDESALSSFGTQPTARP